MTDLVALDLPLGERLVNEIRHAHDRGRAVCVLDPRLTSTRRQALRDLLAPTHVIDDGGETVLRDGRPVEPGDGLVALTSGSSGVPKAAVLTWTAVIAAAEMTATELARGVPTVWNAVLPAAHIGGFAVLARAVFTDDQVRFGDPHDLAVAAAAGATHVAAVRTHLAREDLSRYHVVLLGGGRPPAELPGNVVTTWGMTETGAGVVYNRRPLPAVHLATDNGELLVRSPTLLRAYRDRPAAFVTGPDGTEGWLRTGDAASLRDGELTVYGRIGDVITTGGEKVWPEDLESVLRAVPGVADVAVIGVTDAEWGERIEALVVTDDAPDAVLRAARAAAEERLGPWAKPKAVHRVAAIPRTEGGKVRRSELAALVARPG